MALLLAGAFCLFAALAFVISMMGAAQMTINQSLMWALVAGSSAAGLVFGIARRLMKFLLLCVALQIVAELGLSYLARGTPILSLSPADHTRLLQRIKTEGFLAMLAIMGGYVFGLAFVQKEGERMFGSVTEVRLAQEVHESLVPKIEHKIGEYEIYGASVPSGQVGGDLVDVVAVDGRWMAYVADVSGHGVPAGMIMAMVKSAVRMGSAGCLTPELLPSLNRVLQSLLAANIFVTFSCVAGDSTPQLVFSLAGHLPLLHYRRRHGVVEERSVSNLPLAVIPDTDFAAAEISCEPGDMLAILTDGLTEAADEDGIELGLDPLKAAILETADTPLEEVMNRLRATSLQRGKQTDDQTVLLVRRDRSLHEAR
jgi:sigma-B regulation protein RsbU (phosphoserine phosphatase)